jgi:uncharacterized protein (TIGR03435 family)
MTGQLFLPLPPGQMNQPIKGSSGWIKSDRFTINAKAEGPASLEMMRGPMMQALLEDRFKLKIHREKREVHVYQLAVAKGGPNLQAAKKGSCLALDAVKGAAPSRAPGQLTPTVICGGLSRSNAGGLDVKSVTLPELCVLLSMAADRDVVDTTGIAGAFDLHLDLSFADFHSGRPPAESSDPAAPPIASEPAGTVTGALRKLGLRLQPAKITIEALVIDRVDKPTDN